MTDEGVRPLPLAFGYLNAQGRTPEQIRDEETVIADLAEAEGYALEGVYIETEPGMAGKLSGLLVSARRARAQNQDPRTVFVPTPDDLGTTEILQGMCKQLIEDENALKVVFTRVQPMTRRLAIGYIKADNTRSDTDVETWKAELTSKAQEHDLDLRTIYVEYDLSRKPALEQAMLHIRTFDGPRDKINVLLIPTRTDLGHDSLAWQFIHERLSAFDVEIIEAVSE